MGTDAWPRPGQSARALPIPAGSNAPTSTMVEDRSPGLASSCCADGEPPRPSSSAAAGRRRTGLLYRTVAGHLGPCVSCPSSSDVTVSVGASYAAMARVGAPSASSARACGPRASTVGRSRAEAECAGRSPANGPGPRENVE
jgi:hypothetical protein